MYVSWVDFLTCQLFVVCCLFVVLYMWILKHFTDVCEVIRAASYVRLYPLVYHTILMQILTLAVILP